MPGKFKSYMENIRVKMGRSPEDYWNLSVEKGYIQDGKIVVKHGVLLAWLKNDLGLGHVQANFMILYLRLRVGDSTVSEQAKKWAYETGYLEYCPKD